MPVYIERFTLPIDNEQGIIEHIAGENGGAYGYIDNPYPCGIFPSKELYEVFFKPITIFYGGNGSGKSTLLNLIAKKAELKRIAPHNTGETFDLYVKRCKMEMGQDDEGDNYRVPNGSRSLVWIPCNAVFSDADQKRMEELLAKTDGDISALVGSTITNQDPVRMIPDILQNGDDFFFPVFSSADEMGDYGNGFSKVQKHMIEAIHMALANEKNVVGIVLNAFSEPFVLDKGLFDLVENMKSRITTN